MVIYQNNFNYDVEIGMFLIYNVLLVKYTTWRKHSIMKKIISLISASVICASVSAPVMAASWQKQYPWAKESVEYCLEINIISGDETGDLMLGGNLTREQMAKIFADTLICNQIRQFGLMMWKKISGHINMYRHFKIICRKKAHHLTAVNM